MDSQSRPTGSHKTTDRGFDPTDEQLRQLQIVELPIGNGKNPKLERVALNVELFDKLQEPSVKKYNDAPKRTKKKATKSHRR